MAWHVLREHVRANNWPSKIHGQVTEAPTIILSKVYDEDLGYSLGTIEQWMPKAKLFDWIEQRLRLLDMPTDFVLVPPVGWYRDPDYHEN